MIIQLYYTLQKKGSDKETLQEKDNSKTKGNFEVLTQIFMLNTLPVLHVHYQRVF